MNSIMVAAIAVHELFTSFIKAGFTREEAFDLAKANMIESMRNNQ